MIHTTLPWFRHSKMAPGDFVVTWYVPVRNRRGTVVLDARSLSFESEEQAVASAQELAHARKSEVRFGRAAIIARFARGAA